MPETGAHLSRHSSVKLALMKTKRLKEAGDSNLFAGEVRSSWARALVLSFSLHLFVFLLFFPISISETPPRKTLVIDLACVERNPAGSGPSPERKQSGKKKPAEAARFATGSKGPEQGSGNPTPTASDASPAKTVFPPASTGRDAAGKRLPTDGAPGVGAIPGKQNQPGGASLKGDGSPPTAGRGLPGDGEGEGKERLKGKYPAANFSYIKDIIQKNLTYPPKARLKGWQGSVLVSFVIHENGRVDHIRILRSSGYELLDSNVLQTIRSLGSFPKPPVEAELQMPVVYRLPY